LPPAIDIHQHLWPEPLLAALSRRRRAPMLVRHGDGWSVRVPGEPDAPVDLAAHDPGRRLAALRAEGLDRALIVPSVPLGIEALPAAEAEPLLAAYHDGVAQLPDGLGAWAAVGLDQPDPAALAETLDRGLAGACIAADALASPDGLAALGPVLAVLEARDLPLLVHPGPAPATLVREAAPGLPEWWPALTGYVAGMHAAWHAFAAFGRPQHPRLRVCFVMLAGLAPLHRERLVARGGAHAPDPDVFVDTSSYGPRAIDAVIRELGVDRLVHGSDVPVIPAAGADVLGAAVRTAVRERNPARLLSPNPAKELVA
jgi:predicted TIM-barrel fold metal-dependent hydrolase